MKVDEQQLITTLELLDWSYSAGGEHICGTLKGHDEKNEYRHVEVKHPLSRSEALYMNKKEGCISEWSRHKAGELSERFETEAAVIEAAKEVWKKEFPLAKALVIGLGACAEAQQVLVADREFKKVVNALWRKREKLGGYEGNYKACDKIFHEYQAFLKKWVSKMNGEAT